MDAKLIAMTASTWAAIDAAREKTSESRAAFIERILWRSAEVKHSGIAKDDRPKHGGKR